jgi:transposase InsO family protein
VLDLFNREVVGWSLKPRMTSDIVSDALTMAWFRKKPAAGLMHHSDRRSQYASKVFQRKLKKYSMICSISHKGNCWERQCPNRKLVQQLQERAGAWTAL